MSIAKRASIAVAVILALAVTAAPASAAPQGPWVQPAADLSAAGQNADYPQITTAPDGTATAVWTRYNGSNDIVQAATRPPGGGFGAPVDLSAIGGDADVSRMTTAPDGTATVVWYRDNGSNTIIQSISTARPSFILDVAKSGSGSGTVSSSPAGINCGSDCNEDYLSFTKVILTATPADGSSFTGWSGACEKATGNSCELTMIEDVNATATFGKAKLKITKLKPKKPKVKRGKTVKLKVTAKNTGDGAARNAKLCVKLSKKVKKALKPKGKTCKKLGSLAPGKAKTRPFKLKATGKAKKGKKYKVTFKLSAKGAKTVTRAVKVKIK